MRTLTIVITEQANANITVIDTAAFGARGACVAIKQTAAPGTGTFSIDDIISTTAGNQVFRAAQMYSQTPDANSPNSVTTFLLGNRLQLANNTGGAVRSIVTLYDWLDIPPTGQYQSFYATGTVAALATFTSVTGSTQRSPLWTFIIQGNRAFTCFIDVTPNNAVTWFNVATVATAIAAGGDAVLPVTMPAQTYRLRLRNDDAALVLTYTIAAQVRY